MRSPVQKYIIRAASPNILRDADVGRATEVVGVVVRKRAQRIWVVMDERDCSRGQYGYAVAEWAHCREVGPAVARLLRCTEHKQWGQLMVNEVDGAQFEFMRTFGRKRSVVKICNIPRNQFEQDLLDVVRRDGHVEAAPKSVHLRHHNDRVDVPGHALMECASTEDAASIVLHLNMTKLRGNTLWIQQEEDRGTVDRNEELRGETTAVTVHGLHYSTKKREFWELVGEYGKAEDTKIVVDGMGYPTGKGVVKMRTAEEAERLFELLDERTFKHLTLRTAFGTVKGGGTAKRKKEKSKSLGKKVGVDSVTGANLKIKGQTQRNRLKKTKHSITNSNERIRNALIRRHQRGIKTA